MFIFIVQYMYLRISGPYRWRLHRGARVATMPLAAHWVAGGALYVSGMWVGLDPGFAPVYMEAGSEWRQPAVWAGAGLADVSGTVVGGGAAGGTGARDIVAFPGGAVVANFTVAPPGATPENTNAGFAVTDPAFAGCGPQVACNGKYYLCERAPPECFGDTVAELECAEPYRLGSCTVRHGDLNVSYTFAAGVRPVVRGAVCTERRLRLDVPGAGAIAIAGADCAVTNDSPTGELWHVVAPVSPMAFTAAFWANGTRATLYSEHATTSDVSALFLCVACSVALAIRRGIHSDTAKVAATAAVPLFDVASATAMASFVYGQRVLDTLHYDAYDDDAALGLYYAIVGVAAAVVFASVASAAAQQVATPPVRGLAVDLLLLVTIHAQLPASVLGSTPKHALGAAIGCGVAYQAAAAAGTAWQHLVEAVQQRIQGVVRPAMAAAVAVTLAGLAWAYSALALVYPAAGSGGSHSAIAISTLIVAQAALAGIIRIQP